MAVPLEGYQLLLLLWLISFLVGIGIYYSVIYRPNKDLFSGMNTWDRLLTVFSHIADSNTTPTPHIFAGVLLLMGTSGLVSTATVWIARPHPFDLSLVLSVFSGLTVVFFIAVEIWTLWQTRRLFFSQGYVVADFRRLIVQLTEELNLLERSVRIDHKMKPQKHHRVYVVAPHFFFGMLSFPDSKETLDYRNSLTNICALRKSCASAFDVQFICSDSDSIAKWHVGFFTERDNPQQKVQDANTAFEALVQEMDTKGLREGESSMFTRLAHVPNVQFMVIGNKLFEFTMNSANNSTSIFNTQVLSDSRQCDAYIEQFKFVKRLAAGAGSGGGKPDDMKKLASGG